MVTDQDIADFEIQIRQNLAVWDSGDTVEEMLASGHDIDQLMSAGVLLIESLPQPNELLPSHLPIEIAGDSDAVLDYSDIPF